jgi:type VI protein secretion system component Hcp
VALPGMRFQRWSAAGFVALFGVLTSSGENAMPSDAFMELSDEELWGESEDGQFKKAGLGAFEITQMSFTVGPEDTVPGGTPTGAKDKKADPHVTRLHNELQKLRKELGRTRLAQATLANHTHAAGQDEAKTGKITITKPIDKCSPRLFRDCVTKYENKWAVISVREAGADRTPWLVVELQRVTVVGFRWELTPGDAEGATHVENVDFVFHKILIKYVGQDAKGMHPSTPDTMYTACFDYDADEQNRENVQPLGLD